MGERNALRKKDFKNIVAQIHFWGVRFALTARNNSKSILSQKQIRLMKQMNSNDILSLNSTANIRTVTI
ncbi:MAG: hypothetical protein IKE46_05060 [Selenomonadaceae bacterium]|nr:hypothetical protein [Selenomonadaceae bacterium]